MWGASNRRALMKLLPALIAAFFAASCTVAMAQGDTATKPGTGLDADSNPTGPGANPAAGNPEGAPWAGHGMKTAPVSGTPDSKHKSPQDMSTRGTKNR